MTCSTPHNPQKTAAHERSAITASVRSPPTRPRSHPPEQQVQDRVRAGQTPAFSTGGTRWPFRFAMVPCIRQAPAAPGRVLTVTETLSYPARIRRRPTVSKTCTHAPAAVTPHRRPRHGLRPGGSSGCGRFASGWPRGNRPGGHPWWSAAPQHVRGRRPWVRRHGTRQRVGRRPRVAVERGERPGSAAGSARGESRGPASLRAAAAAPRRTSRCDPPDRPCPPAARPRSSTPLAADVRPHCRSTVPVV